MITRSYNKDDSGSNLMIEYILTIAIAALLFSVLLSCFQSIITKSDQIIMSEEMDIVGSIIANQLTDYSNQLRLNDYTGIYSQANSMSSNRYFDVPKPYSGKQYQIQVSDQVINVNEHMGRVKIIYVSNPNIYSIYTFNSPYEVQPKTITCNTYRLKVSLYVDPVSQSKSLVLEEA